MKRIMTIPAVLLLAAFSLILGPAGALAAESGSACMGCHFSYFGSPQEVCISCHQGALHYRHIYQDPGDEQFTMCGWPPDKCKCCHGEPPDYENPPVVADKCTGCHSVTGSDIVANHNCSPFYEPDAEEHCLDCHGLEGTAVSLIVSEEDANDNCNDTLDNDADCSKDNEDPNCTGLAEDEICDDAKDNDFDGLIDGEDPDCCGDGAVTPPEACDDGNTRDCDGCSAACEEESCGDGIVCAALGEECDGAVGCGEGYSCDDTCTCRAEAEPVVPCGASTTGSPSGDERTALNLSVLLVPVFFLLLLRWGRFGVQGRFLPDRSHRRFVDPG